MPSFDRINRRTHLYTGLFLLPWLLMYGLSSFLVIHQSWFRSDQAPAWEPLFEKEYRRPVSDKDDLRTIAQAILKDCHLEGAFWVNKPNPDTLHIDRFSVWGSTRLTYSPKEERLKAERQRVRLPQAVIRMHFRGGYLQPTIWDKLWGLVVDVTCLGILIWVGSGLYMWWRLARLRLWGAAAIVGGLCSFLLLIWRL